MRLFRLNCTIASLLAGLQLTFVEPLQRVQNAAARLVLNLVSLWSRDTSTEAVTLVTCRTQNQIQPVYTDAWNSHTGCAPQYLAHSVQSIAESSRRPGLRSTNTADYIKRLTRTKFGEWCFSHAGPAAWYSLPDSIKLATDTSRF